MLAKKRNDLCLRAINIYKELLDELHPRVRFGFIDVLRDEGLKVAFNEEQNPWSFAIIEGRAYKYYALERGDEILAYFKDLEQWKKMRVQFDVPKRAANRAEIILFDIWKETKKVGKPAIRGYMEWYHWMRTGEHG